MDLIRERLDTPGDVGNEKKDLEIITKNEINLEYIVENQWWSYFEQKNKEKIEIDVESKNNVKRRILLFFIWMSQFPDQYMCIVSHSNVFKYIAGVES